MIISSLKCLVKTLSIYLSHSLLVTIWKRRSRTTILIFKGIGTKEAISTSIASARPAAIGRVGKVEKAKYNPARYNLVLSPPSYLDMRSSI